MMILLRLCLTLALVILLTNCARQAAGVEEYVCTQPCRPNPTYQASDAPPRITTPPKPVKPISAADKPTAAAKARPGTKPLIIIDPGHGGKDLGAVSLTKPVYQEKNLNLASARLLEGFLKSQGYRTLMTRTDDTFLTLEERTELAKAKNGQLFISVHFNSAPSRTAEGIEVFYYESDKEKERTKSSLAMAQAVLDKVIAATGANSRGVKHGNFAVIRNNSMPAILIEGGFMTHEKEMEKLKDPLYLKKLALGIAQGIDQYVQAQGNAKK